MKLLEQKIFFKLRDKGERNTQKTPAVSQNDERNLFPYSQFTNWPNVGMRIPKGYILVDIDNEYFGTRLLKIIKDQGLNTIISKTGKGYHFLFKDFDPDRLQGSRKPIALGIEVDYRTPFSKGYAAVKFFPDREKLNNDGLRIIENIDIDIETLDEIPIWLLPVTNISDISKEIITNEWKSGSRDQSMRDWSHIVWDNPIKTKKELYDTFILINKYICDKPLFTSEKALKDKLNNWNEYTKIHNKKDAPRKKRKSATRKLYELSVEKRKKEQQERKILDVEFVEVEEENEEVLYEDEIDYDTLSKEIIDYLHIKYYDNDLWMKRPGKNWHIRADMEQIDSYVVKKYKGFAAIINLKILERFLRAYSEVSRSDDRDYYMPFKNGFYDIRTDKMYNYISNPKFFTFGANHNYNPNAYNSTVDKSLDTWTQDHKDERIVLENFIGMCFVKENTYATALFLEGFSARNGKSTFQKMLEHLFGYQAFSTLNLDNLEGTHETSSLRGTRILAIDDVNDQVVKKANIFKSLITGGRFTTNKKYGAIRPYLPTQKVLASFNNFPHFLDQSDGIWRRITLLPFKWKYDPIKDKDFDQNLLFNESAMEYLITLAIKGLKRFTENKSIGTSERGEILKNRLKMESNSVMHWLSFYSWEPNHTLDLIYGLYKNFCYDNGHKNPLGKIKFAPKFEESGKYELKGSKNGSKMVFIKDNHLKKTYGSK